MTQGFDKDLTSIQEARRLIEGCYMAQEKILEFSQEQVDRICQAMADAAYQAAERLGRMATEETSFGVPRAEKPAGQPGCMGIHQRYQNSRRDP